MPPVMTPPPNPRPHAPRPRRHRPRPGLPAGAPACHVVLEAMAAMPTATPTVGELAGAMATAAEVLARVLARMEQNGQVEHWRDDTRPGTIRVMLSAGAVARLGVALAPRGDRWQAAGTAPGRRAT